MKEQAMVAHVRQVEGIMSELVSEFELAAAQAQGNSWALPEQYKLQIQEQQREKRMGILEGDLRGLVPGEQLQQVEERMGELEEWAGNQLQQVKDGIARLNVDDIVERLYERGYVGLARSLGCRLIQDQI